MKKKIFQPNFKAWHKEQILQTQITNKSRQATAAVLVDQIRYTGCLFTELKKKVFHLTKKKIVRRKDVRVKR